MLALASAHQFTCDAVQMPLNVMDHHFNSFEAKVLPVLQKQNIGVLAMSPWRSIHSAEQDRDRLECLHYAMNLPTSVVITGCDSLPILQQAVNAARSLQPMRKQNCRTVGENRKGTPSRAS